MANEIGEVSRFFLENPPVGIATGALGMLAVVATIIRMFRSEVRSAAVDKAAAAVLKAVQDDNAVLRGLLDAAHRERDNARRDLLSCQIELGGKIAGLVASVDVMSKERDSLEHKLEKVTDELKEENTLRLELEMRVGAQLSTIEDLGAKIRRLETRESNSNRRRSTD